MLYGTLTKSVATWHPKARYYKTPLKLVATRHSYKARCYTAPLQSPLLHDTLKLVATCHLKVHCYTTPLTKPVATRHSLWSLLLHDTLYKACCYTAPYYKACYYMTPYYKGLCYVVIFYKISNYFIKSLILFWQHFTKDPLQLNPNTILATFYKKPNTTLANFIKNPKLLIFGQKIILSKPKYYLAKILYYAQILKLIIFGNNIFWHAKSPSKYNNWWET